MRVSLYECLNARVKNGEIYCRKNHRLSRSVCSTVPLKSLQRGKPLVFATCKNCPDFCSMGGPVPEEERGWTKLVNLRKN